MKIDVLNQYQRDEEYASMSDAEFAQARHDAFIDMQNSEICLEDIDEYVEFGFHHINGFHHKIEDLTNEWGLIWFLQDYPETNPCCIEWSCFLHEGIVNEFFERLTNPTTIVNVGKYWLKHVDSFAPLDLVSWPKEHNQSVRNERKLLKANIKERIEKAKNELELTKKKEKPASKKKEQASMFEFADIVVKFAKDEPNNAGAMRSFLRYLAFENKWTHSQLEKYLLQIPSGSLQINQLGQLNMGNGSQTTNTLPEPQQ